MSDYPMLISNKLHSFRNFMPQIYGNLFKELFQYKKHSVLKTSFRFISIHYVN